MSPASRRILAYWLLLLLPALGVGLGAILLLRREQTRLAERAAVADEARRAAVTSRASLIAENVELLIGDVQVGLLDVIAAEPAGRLDGLLDQLEANNPLVRTAFRSTLSGALLRPTSEQTSENGRSFRRLFGDRLRESPPWRQEPTATVNLDSARPAPTTSSGAAGALAEREQRKIADDQRSRQQVSSNVSKLTSARRDAQALARNSLPDTVASNSNAAKDRSESYSTAASRLPVAAEVGATAPSRSDSTYGKSNAPRVEAPPALATREQRGWLPLVVDGRLHVLGWVLPAGAAEVRGLELETEALLSRLNGTLPAEISAMEGYALRDAHGRILHQVGNLGRAATPTITVPLAAELLPGWDVAAFLPATNGNLAEGGGFFLIGSLLVAIFVTAIVAGGSLLLWQARRSEAEAVQKTSFVANVSHEFKTPLTTIRLYAELLEQGRVRDADQSRDYLRTIGRETQRLARLVGNALDFSRLEQGQKRYAREPLDLRAELTRLLDTQEPRLAEAGLRVDRALPTDPLPVTSDRDALEQILLNLLDNAAKYGAGGGEVTVELAPRPAGGAEIRVLDRGPGVPPDHHERIFDKFHRVDDTLTAQETGTGLGLSIARQLARGLGGELHYAPRAGGGASFTLTLK